MLTLRTASSSSRLSAIACHLSGPLARGVVWSATRVNARIMVELGQVVSDPEPHRRQFLPGPAGRSPGAGTAVAECRLQAEWPARVRPAVTTTHQDGTPPKRGEAP